MNKLKKVQGLSLFKRKVILFAVLFALAVPLVVLIGYNLTEKVVGFEGKPLFDQFEVNQEIGESFLQVQEATEELREHMENMPDMSTSSTSTDVFATSTLEDLNN